MPSLTAGAPRPDVVWLPVSLPPTPPAWLSGKVVLCTRSPLHPGQMGRAAPHSGLEAAATEGHQGLSGLMEPIRCRAQSPVLGGRLAGLGPGTAECLTFPQGVCRSHGRRIVAGLLPVHVLDGALLSHLGASLGRRPTPSWTVHTLAWGRDHSCSIPGPPVTHTRVTPAPCGSGSQLLLWPGRVCAPTGSQPQRPRWPRRGSPLTPTPPPQGSPCLNPHHGLALHSAADTPTQLSRPRPPLCGFPRPDYPPSPASWWGSGAGLPGARGAQHGHPGGLKKSSQSLAQPNVQMPPQVLPPAQPGHQGGCSVPGPASAEQSRTGRTSLLPHTLLGQTRAAQVLSPAPGK